MKMTEIKIEFFTYVGAKFAFALIDGEDFQWNGMSGADGACADRRHPRQHQQIINGSRVKFDSTSS